MDIIVTTPKSERANAAAEARDLRLIILLICAALVLVGCHSMSAREEPAGTLVSITANPNSFTDAITCTVTTTTHVLIVRGRISGRIGAPCRIRSESSFRWLYIDGTEGRVRIL